jgi:hypothetical protein
MPSMPGIRGWLVLATRDERDRKPGLNQMRRRFAIGKKGCRDTREIVLDEADPAPAWVGIDNFSTGTPVKAVIVPKRNRYGVDLPEIKRALREYSVTGAEGGVGRAAVLTRRHAEPRCGLACDSRRKRMQRRAESGGSTARCGGDDQENPRRCEARRRDWKRAWGAHGGQ